MKQQIHVPGLESGFHPYPAAVKHAGLVLVSGVRSTGHSRSAALAEMQKEPRRPNRLSELVHL